MKKRARKPLWAIGCFGWEKPVNPKFWWSGALEQLKHDGKLPPDAWVGNAHQPLYRPRGGRPPIDRKERYTNSLSFLTHDRTWVDSHPGAFPEEIINGVRDSKIYGFSDNDGKLKFVDKKVGRKFVRLYERKGIDS